MSKIAYVRGLKVEVCQTLCPSANVAEVMLEIILHNESAFFLVFSNRQSAQTTIQSFAGKPVFDVCGRIDALNSETYQILMQLKPELFGAPAPIGHPVSTS